MSVDQDGNPLIKPQSIKVIFYQTDKEFSNILSSDDDNKNHAICIKDLIELEEEIFNK